MTLVDKLMGILQHAGPFEDCFNPWTDRDPLDTDEKAPEARLSRLRQHFSLDAPRLLLLGEAAGYAGCRFSGVAFTSERLITEGVIPRIPTLPRFTSRHRPFSEQSATIVWRTLYKNHVADTTLLWNAFPLHPHRPGDALTNRTPKGPELAAGIACIEQILDIYHGIQVVAVGGKAFESLTALGISCQHVRHPANGGATAFSNGIAQIVAR